MFTREKLAEMPEYHRRFGTIGFKFFPGIKGADAAVMTALPHTGPMLGIDDPFVLDGMRGLAAIPGALTLYHAENPELNHAAAERVKAEGRADLRAWCDSRRDHGEAHSVRDGIWWQRLTGAPLYIVHLSSAVALETVLEERRRGPRPPLYVETCPQFLTHTRESPIGTIGKMSPPFRTQADSDRLWQGIAAGEIQTIASDHGAFMREDKRDAWSGRSGFPGMATILPALMTHGVRAGRISVADVVRVFSANVARIFGLYPRKGTLAIGADADLIVVDPESERGVDARMLHSRSDFSIYGGQTLGGWPTHVVSRGRVLLRDGTLVTERGGGRFLRTPLGARDDGRPDTGAGAIARGRHRARHHRRRPGGRHLPAQRELRASGPARRARAAVRPDASLRRRLTWTRAAFWDLASRRSRNSCAAARRLPKRSSPRVWSALTG
jgi:dihydroorotase-like cyclic amidohydrolase